MSSRLYSTNQVRSFDRSAIETLGIPGYDLMQRAATAAWHVLRAKWPQARRIAVFCGAGNNGGDGYLLACLVREAGLEAFVVELAPPARAGDAERACAQWRSAGGQTVRADAELPLADVHVDALFGTGLTRAIDGDARKLIERLNASGRPLLALDLPSGIDANTGSVLGIAVRATVTISFVAHKRGLFTGAALDHCGEMLLDTLELPDSIFKQTLADTRLMVMRRMMRWLPPRQRDANKGIFGHVLAVGSDAGMGGAIRLSSEAALRVGAGLVSVATRPENVAPMNAARPELMARGVVAVAQLAPLLERADVVAIGPGLGDSEWAKTLWQTALDAGKPTVLDADGLNLLASHPRRLPQPVVITPHPGEAARLLECDSATIQRDRFAAVIELARRFRAVTVLKGAGSLVAHPEGGVLVCPWGNPGMASAGMGDVLTGVIAGLLAQGLNCWRAARLGVALHAQAGDAAAAEAGQAGLLASDLFVPLRRLRNAQVDNG
ncbi:MAG TPA: NAD(P)H-hydrate dehydratase [Rudaea sp.]|nr:NAD(P)H-hydrate dehydratase [Rudaea sp.]